MTGPLERASELRRAAARQTDSAMLANAILALACQLDALALHSDPLGMDHLTTPMFADAYRVAQLLIANVTPLSEDLVVERLLDLALTIQRVRTGKVPF
jgi:hypothetical protein